MAPCLSLTCVLEEDEAAIERSEFNATSVADVDKRVKRRLLMGNTFLPLPLLSLLLCPRACECGVRAACRASVCWRVALRGCVRVCGRVSVWVLSVCVVCPRVSGGLHARWELTFSFLTFLPFIEHMYFFVCVFVAKNPGPVSSGLCT